MGSISDAHRTALHASGRQPLRPHPLRHHQERDPQSRRVGRVFARRRRSPGRLEPGRGRRAGAEIFPQSRHPRAGEAGRGGDRSLVPVALRPRRDRAELAAEGRARGLRDFGQAGVRPSRRRLGLLGLEVRLFRRRRRRARLLRRDALHARAPDGRAQFAAMVQHRASLGLWRRRAEPGPLLRRLRDGQARQVEVGLRASPAARLLHPVGRRRSRQRGRDHGPLGARGAPVQIRLRHRLELFACCAARTRSFRAAGARRASCRS